jgi:tetratricopeptide (TPR) repeat protein
LLLLHIPVVLMWVLGIAFISRRSLRLAFIAPASIVSPLLLGLFTFPGFGPFTYSIALVLMRCLRYGGAEEAVDAAEQSLGTMAHSLTKPRTLDLAIQPLVDVLHDVDMETRRTAITVLSRSATPGAIQLLRQLLSDPHLEIRSDASLALTRIEDELSWNLNTALEQWTANPTDMKYILHLVQQYCDYADSNLLDEVSERVYLEKARDLLEQVIAEGHRDAEQVMRLARIRQRLGEMTRALRDVDVAHQLAPQAPEAYMLAMELAFRLHDWDRLIALARESMSTLPGDTRTHTSLWWWASLHSGQ